RRRSHRRAARHDRHDRVRSDRRAAGDDGGARGGARPRVSDDRRSRPDASPAAPGDDAALHASGMGPEEADAIVIATTTPADTEQVAHRLGAAARSGDVIALVGPLGAGKTAFVRGLAAGLGIDPDDVASPTFTMI